MKENMKVASMTKAMMTAGKTLLAVVAAVVATTLVACSSDDEKNPVVDPNTDNELRFVSLTRAQQEMVKHSNDFAFNLLRQAMASGELKGKSLMLSPISVTYALGMLNNGATGETQQQINQVLGFGETGAAGINDFCHKMLTEATALDKLTKMMIANTIFMNKDYQLKPTFVEMARQYYEATPETRNFKDGKTRNVINKWGSDHTEGMIKEVLTESEFNPEAVSYLLNAIYFKGTWTEKFDKAKTKQQAFTRSDGTRQQLPMMSMEHEFNYVDTEHYQAVRLPYGNGAYSMTVLLPHEGQTVDDVLVALATSSWSNYLGEPAIVDLKLPRFETDTNVNLKALMQQLGLTKAFTEYAEFPDFCNKATYIDMMKQVARIKLDEAGTEAAAVTVIGMETTSMPEPVEPRRVTFHATRPFLYVISEQSTGAIFFVGAYFGEG